MSFALPSTTSGVQWTGQSEKGKLEVLDSPAGGMVGERKSSREGDNLYPLPSENALMQAASVVSLIGYGVATTSPDHM